MNTNLKNGLINLALFGSSAAIVGGIGYGAYKALTPNKKPDIMVTDPQKAEQDLQTESDVSRVFFEASQNIQTGNTEAAATEEETPVADISGLCREIAAYQSIINDITNAKKTGKTGDVGFLTGSAERKEQEIRKALEEFGYKKPNTPIHIEKLGNSFEEYVQKAKEDIAVTK